jgi:hypothetical protein
MKRRIMVHYYGGERLRIEKNHELREFSDWQTFCQYCCENLAEYDIDILFHNTPLREMDEIREKKSELTKKLKRKEI